MSPPPRKAASTGMFSSRWATMARTVAAGSVMYCGASTMSTASNEPSAATMSRAAA